MDALAEKHDFPVPQGMVDLEFESIWKQVQPELTPEEKEKPEDEVKAEYRGIAERRVRLGPAAQRSRQAQQHPGSPRKN